MRLETFIRKSLRMKAHCVTQVEERPDGGVVAHVDRLPGRHLRCGECGCPVAKVAPTRRPERRWRDLALRDQPLWLVYAPHRVCCPQCGLRVERIPWAEKWQRVTHALARKLDWASVAAHFRLIWKTVASVVEAVVLWGLAHRRWVPLHRLGIDEVSRRKGQQYLTLVYDLERRRVVGKIGMKPRSSTSSPGWESGAPARSTSSAATCGGPTSRCSGWPCPRPLWSSTGST